jgi:Outer membrane protein beta-barrel domain
MNRLRNILLLLAFSALVLNQAWAQPRSFRYWSIGVSIGAMHYQGDLDDNGFQPWITGTGADENQKWGNPLRLLRPGFGASAFYHFHPHMNLEVGARYGWIGASDENVKNSGSNAFRKFRNLDFRNRIFEASAVLNYEFFATDRHYRFRPRFTPYVFAGIVGFYHNPFTFLRDGEIEYYQTFQPGLGNLEQYRDQRVYLQGLRTEAQGSQNLSGESPGMYSLFQIGIPLGIGLRWSLSERLDLRFSAGMRITFTDHLDDVGSYFYANPADYLNGTYATENQELSYILSDRSYYRPAYGRQAVDDGFGIGNSTGYNVQSSDLDAGRAINEEQGEKRGFPNQNDWYAYTGVTLSYVLDPGDRCPKFR